MLLDINEEITNIILMDSGILTVVNASRHKYLQDKKRNLMAHEVTTQRLKSKFLWLKEGDANTKLFHAYASAKKNSNAIWSLKDTNGNLVSDDVSLKKLSKQHFSDLFMDDKSLNIANQLKVIRLFPTFTPEEEVNSILEPVTLQEVEVVLKGFKKDKSPWPDGWPVEFFLAFFDLIGEELTFARE